MLGKGWLSRSDYLLVVIRSWIRIPARHCGMGEGRHSLPLWCRPATMPEPWMAEFELSKYSCSCCSCVQCWRWWKQRNDVRRSHSWRQPLTTCQFTRTWAVRRSTSLAVAAPFLCWRLTTVERCLWVSFHCHHRHHRTCTVSMSISLNVLLSRSLRTSSRRKSQTTAQMYGT